jgi:hypothetical protein
MPPLLLPLFLTLYLTTIPSLAQVAQERRLSPLRYATLGEAVTGEVLTEDDDELRLNVRPCAAERIVVILREPYTKGSAGTIQCSGVTKALVQAIQR